MMVLYSQRLDFSHLFDLHSNDPMPFFHEAIQVCGKSFKVWHDTFVRDALLYSLSSRTSPYP